MRRILDDNGELIVAYRPYLYAFLLLYSLAICVMCFSPQPHLVDVETPGVMFIGRVAVLLVPFNSLVNLPAIHGWFDMLWIFGQNLINVFLLYPLLLGLTVLYPALRSYRTSLIVAFCFSLSIESMQVILDLLWNFNRVFEIDDLWTNSLGGLLSYWSYEQIKKVLGDVKS